MFIIDMYAYQSRLRYIHPAEKASFALLTTFVGLFADSLAVSLVILGVVSYLIVVQSGIPKGIYIKLLVLPLAFLAVGAFGMLLTFTDSGNSEMHKSLLFFWRTGPYLAGFDPVNLWPALKMLIKALATVSCMYFLALSTPMVEVSALLHRLGLPALFIELFSLVYRFIFVIIETANEIYTSQTARLGYISIYRSFRSFSQLVTVLFIRSFHKSQQLFIALQSRGYQGQLRVLQPEFRWSVKNWVLIGFFEIGIALIGYYQGGN